MSGIFEINAHIKDYAWGSKDSSSWVAKIAKSQGISAATFAEAWYGDHQNGPSTHNNKNLNDLNLYSEKLRFLGKILSIARPLSIQVHPDPKIAELLNRANPSEFKDANGKDEGAIALTKLELAHSLVSDSELKQRLASYPELTEILKLKNISSTSQALKLVLEVSKDEIKLACKKLWSRLDSSKLDLLNKNLKNLEKLYPEGDVGVLVLILMNIFELQPGEAIYTPTGCPHAYLSGELIEIMKPSDNVLRCGLTDKKIDVSNFIAALKPQQTSAPIKATKNLKFELGELFIEIITSNSSIFSGNNPKIMFSLDSYGKLISGKTEVPFRPLSSFLIIRDKTLDIVVDSGRIILFGDN